MRIIVTGDKHWRADELAASIVNRLLASYGPDIVIVHGGSPGIDQSVRHRVPEARSRG